MPGLSRDPDAAQRQLDALARGRHTQARSWLTAAGYTVTEPEPEPEPEQRPGARARARASQRKPGHDVPVHSYPDADPEPERTPGREDPDERRDPKPEPAQPERGGLLGRLGEGLRLGALD